jgi:hypothetical protein
MKRFHVHVGVDDLEKSMKFYSSMFGASPSVVKGDYAKWMLEDPALNFAISTRAGATGVDHLGLQTDDSTELAAMKARAESADLGVRDDGVTTCCYARSDKHWITDPQGIAWEHFHSLGDIPVFREAAPATASAEASACCAPSGDAEKIRGISIKTKSPCC